jgi:hypothetical protein
MNRNTETKIATSLPHIPHDLGSKEDALDGKPATNCPKCESVN